MYRMGLVGFTAVAAMAQTGAHQAPEPAPVLESYIVEAASTADARSAVVSVGGEIAYDLPVIDAVAARLSSSQREELAKLDRIDLECA
jgi:hypothetical protein